MLTTKCWMIWSNEHNQFWKPDRCGYTSNSEMAGRYTINEATVICSNANQCRKGKIPCEILIPSPEVVDAITKLTDGDRLSQTGAMVGERGALEQFLAHFSVDMFGEGSRAIGPARAKILAAGLLSSGLINSVPGREEMIKTICPLVKPWMDGSDVMRSACKCPVSIDTLYGPGTPACRTFIGKIADAILALFDAGRT